MSSHLARLQHHQARQNQLYRTGSSSSLRSVEANQQYANNFQVNAVGGGQGSIISGSLLSGEPNNNTVREHYEAMQGNQKDGNVNGYSQAGSALGNNHLQNGSYIGRPGYAARSGSIVSYQTSTMAGKSTHGGRSLYSPSHLKMSRSLGASKASLVTAKSGRSTIQAEHHDMKIQNRLNAVTFGKARTPYIWAVVFFSLFGISLFVGLLILCLRQIYMNILLSLDIGEMTGPLICALSFAFFGIGMKFYNDAYKLGAQERRRLKYKPASISTVTVSQVTSRAPDQNEELISGKTTQNALSRAPVISGSQNTLVSP